MEEKERYEYFFGTNTIKDNINKEFLSYKRVIDTLNQQDKRIKELEKRLAENNEFFNAFACKDFNEFKDFISTFMLAPHEEQTLIRELKQQLHDLPKKIVGEIKDISLDYWDFNSCEECGYIADLSTLTIKDFDEILDTTLKKYGGENESNND